MDWLLIFHIIFCDQINSMLRFEKNVFHFQMHGGLMIFINVSDFKAFNMVS